jgi:hypothetical protein
MKTYIVARDYGDGHQLTRFVTTDDEKELRKHWTRIAPVEDMHNGILQLCACGTEGLLHDPGAKSNVLPIFSLRWRK